MATKRKTKKAAKRKPMFRAETAGEKLKNGGVTPGVSAQVVEPSIQVYAFRGESVKKHWRLDLRGGLPVGQCVEVVAVDALSGCYLATLAKISAAGLVRMKYVDEQLDLQGYEAQGMVFDGCGRVKVEN